MDRRNLTSRHNGQYGGRPRGDTHAPALWARQLFYQGHSIKEISFCTQIPSSSLYRYANEWAQQEVKIGISGYFAQDLQLIHSVCQDLQLRPVLIDMPFPKLLLALENSQVDVGISSLSPTEERKRKMYFTAPYTHEEDPIDFYALSKTKIHSIEQIFKGSFGTVKGTLHEIFLKNLGVKVKYFANDILLELALRQGNIDCFLSNLSAVNPYLLNEISRIPNTLTLNYGLRSAMAIAKTYQKGEQVAKVIEKINARRASGL